MLVLVPAYMIIMQVRHLRPSYVKPECVQIAQAEKSSAQGKAILSFLVYLIAYMVVALVCMYSGLLYAVILLEIMSFVFMWLSHLQTSEPIQVSSHLKESLLSYLIPSLLSYVCALVGLYLSGGAAEIAESRGLVGFTESGEKIIKLPSLPYMVFMTLALGIKMGVFPFFVYTLNVSQGVSWNAIFFLGITSKVPLVIVLVNCGTIIHEHVLIIVGLSSMLVSCLVIFNSVYMKRFIAGSSLSVMGWISTLVALFRYDKYGYGEEFYMDATPMYMSLWLFFVTYSINTLLILIMLENCYPLFLSSYKGEVDFAGMVLGTVHHVWLRRLGMVGIISQMGLPPLAFFGIKYVIFLYMVKMKVLVSSTILVVMVINSAFFFGAYIWFLWNILRGKAMKVSEWKKRHLHRTGENLTWTNTQIRQTYPWYEYAPIIRHFVGKLWSEFNDFEPEGNIYILYSKGTTAQKVMSSLKNSNHVVTGGRIWYVLFIAVVLVTLLVNDHSIHGSIMRIDSWYPKR